MDATEQEEFDRKSDRRAGGGGGGSTPNPDPTDLTREALLREIAALKTLIDQRISATEALFDTKIQAGREGGLALKELLTQQANDLKDVAKQFREEMSERAESAAALLDEKFKVVDTRFGLIEDQRKELKSDSATSLAAALAAQKEQAEKQTTTFTASIEKSETSQVRQFDQISSNFKTEIAGIVGTISDIKDRLTTIESFKRGGEESDFATRANRTDSRATLSVSVAVVGGLVTIALLVLAAASFIGR